MADLSTFPDILRGAVLAAGGLTFYDGQVPDKVPHTGEFIDPYVVLWAGIGDNPNETPACGTQSTDVNIWDFQLTVVAASANLCRDVAGAVLARVLNLRLGTGKVRRNPDGFNQQTPIPDNQTSPARYLLPLQLRLITN
ncbi:hypothetical protein [Arthrobacter sp. SD76]|uniref:hypothetical protein n=1 Tax=Arthrobacter sp. SD76 TaxID=3415007 RepID=UPI003C75DC12